MGKLPLLNVLVEELREEFPKLLLLDIGRETHSETFFRRASDSDAQCPVGRHELDPATIVIPDDSSDSLCSRHKILLQYS